MVRHCLEKSPEERFASARDLAFDLQALSDTTIERREAAPRRRRRALAAASALVLAWVLTGAGAFVLGRRTATAPQPDFRLLRFRRGAVRNARFAPDGKSFFYNAQWGEGWGTYTASLDSPEPRPVAPSGHRRGRGLG